MMALPLSRRLFLKLAGVGFAVASIFMPLTAAHADTDGAGKFVQGLGDKAISVLADKTKTPEQAGQVFREMLHNSFDLDLLGKFALGPANWRAATAEQKAQYLKLFEKLVVQIYSDRFKLYSGESFKVASTKAEDDRDTYVTSDIVKPGAGAAPVQVDWRVRNKGGRYQVIDVIVEGVSMSVTQRSEFAAVIQKNGGDLQEFLKILAERVAMTEQK